MQQPELGRQLGLLRKEKNLTQEELVEKSNVSVRTIQRIENGEVHPRISTIKILLEALGENYDSFLINHEQNIDDQNRNSLNVNSTILIVAMLAGTVYLTSQIILGIMDINWLTKDDLWQFSTNAIYVGLTVIMVISFTLFATLSHKVCKLKNHHRDLYFNPITKYKAKLV